MMAQHPPHPADTYAKMMDDADGFDGAREPLSAIRDLIAERTYALHLAAGALQCVAKLLPDREQHIVSFTGEWQQFGNVSIADILDRANLALEG